MQFLILIKQLLRILHKVQPVHDHHAHVLVLLDEGGQAADSQIELRGVEAFEDDEVL